MAIKPWSIIPNAGDEIRTREFDSGKVWSMLYRKNMTSQVLLSFMSRFVKENDRKVFLIRESLLVHHNMLVKVWQEEHEEEVAAFYLPSYTPELNRDEYFNSDHKHCIGAGLPELGEKAWSKETRSFIRILQNRPKYDSNDFKHPKIAYAA